MGYRTMTAAEAVDTIITVPLVTATFRYYSIECEPNQSLRGGIILLSLFLSPGLHTHIYCAFFCP